jgi:hypothetical protein
MSERPIESMSVRQIHDELCELLVEPRAFALALALFEAAIGERDAEVDVSEALAPRPPSGSHEAAWREASMENIAGTLHLYTRASKRECYSMAEAITDSIESRIALYTRERSFEPKQDDNA